MDGVTQSLLFLIRMNLALLIDRLELSHQKIFHTKWCSPKLFVVFPRTTLSNITFCEQISVMMKNLFIFSPPRRPRRDALLWLKEVFWVSGMQKSDSSCKITPIGVIFRKKSRKNFFEKNSRSMRSLIDSSTKISIKSLLISD